MLTYPRPRIALSASTYALLSLTVGFALLISLGTVALMLPPASVEPGAAPFITALFTATSAVCVTGLVVETTGKYWSYFGQSIILVLMFVGGLGLMTATMSFLVLVGQRVPLNARLAVRETLAGTSLASVLKVSRYILLFAVVTQAMGFGALFITFMAIYPRDLAAWSAFFHSVSAFNNAGFDIFMESSSLVAYHGYYPLVIIIGILIALGGLSFPVLAELWRVRRVSRWTLDTRLVIHGSLFLWALGILVVLIFEWNNSITLGGMTLPGKLINAWFQSVTAR
ncbi:MAG TPA: potassium transporter TrkG, partial [Dehalococcoidia bacterium]|nr:potassium transporter TrkG [Dehalococcoidia bacterium]